MKKRSQSGIITAVLLIIIVIVGIVVVWNVVYSILKKSTNTSGLDILTTQLELKQAKLYVTGGSEVQVHRGSGSGTMTGLKIIFENKNGERTSVSKDIVINELETRNIEVSKSDIGYNNSDINAVYIVPMFGNTAGIEISEDAVSKDANGNRELNNPEGLVSWWKFNGNMMDYVIGNHGSCTSPACPVLTTDNKGNANSAYNFNGINQYIQVPYSPNQNFVDKFTLSFWLYYQTPFSSDWTYVFLKGDDSSRGYGAYGHLNYIAVTFFDDAGNELGYPYTFPQTGKWYNIVATYDKNIASNNFKLYVNGNPIGQVRFTSNLIASNTGIRIGKWREPGYKEYFNGSMDNIMIFNQSISPEEVTAIYNNQK